MYYVGSTNYKLLRNYLGTTKNLLLGVSIRYYVGSTKS